MGMDTEVPMLSRIRELVAPIAADLGLDLYDIEQRGGTLRITLDTPAGAAGGITLDVLALASRLVSKELDQNDPIPSRYTLEVTSPGVERALRVPATSSGRSARRSPSGWRTSRQNSGACGDDPRRRRRSTDRLRRHRPRQDRVRMERPTEAGHEADG